MMVVMPLGHCGCAEQGNRLLGHARGVADQVVFEDHFPAAAGLIAAEGVWVAADLHVPFGNRSGRNPTARLNDFLVQVAAFGAGESLALAQADQVALRHFHASHCAHRRIGGQQQLDLLLRVRL